MTPSYLTRTQVIEKLEAERGGDTLEVFSGRVGVSLSGLCNILKGARKPGPKVLAFLSRNDRRTELQEVEAYQYVLREK